MLILLINAFISIIFPTVGKNECFCENNTKQGYFSNFEIQVANIEFIWINLEMKLKYQGEDTIENTGQELYKWMQK